MSFFRDPPPKPAEAKALPGFSPPDRKARGDRTLAVRIDDPVPDHRVPGVTLEKSGKVGLTNARVLERLPRGCLFKVAGGFFDLDGFWCVQKADRHPEVRRGATKKVMRLLSVEQRRTLERVRLRARRQGVR